MCCIERIALVIVLLIARTVAALNLVPNPSFETYTTCPANLGEVYKATPWDLPTAGTADYYNACAPNTSFVSVPSNAFGVHTTHTGVAYMGAHCRPVNNYREYIQAPLTQPLTAGQTVHVSFWVALSSISQLAIDRLGAYLSVGPVGPINTAPALPYTPQIESPTGTFLNDKTNWMQIAGNYTAAGGEDHIVIGNFHDNTTTNTQPVTGSFPGAYYYIDDVAVEIPDVTSTYAAKFICGVQTDADPTHVVDAEAGQYATKINVHNNTGVPIHFRKKAIRLKGGEVPTPPADKKPVEALNEDQAMEVVCRDVYDLLNIPIIAGQTPPYIEGFVVLEVFDPPPDPLDVEGVYTYRGTAGVRINVKVFPPK